jgi:hypothetical protein
VDRAVGGVLGLAGGLAVLLSSLAKSGSLADALWRAAAAVFLGYWIGRLVVGPLGLSIGRDAAGKVPAAEPPKPPPKTS